MDGRLDARESGPDTAFSWKRASAVFIAALVLRAVFATQWAHLPYIDSLAIDAWACDRWALDILNGHLIRHTAFYQSPFYPYFLAGFYKLFGHHPQAVLWLQAVLDSGTCVLIMRAAQLAYGARAGLAAGLLAAVYRPFIFDTALLTKETFVLFALALFLIALLRAGEGNLPRRRFLCGLAAGWCLLLRPNAVLLAPAAMLWLWLRAQPPRNGRAFIKGAVFPLVLGALLPVLPAALHNYAASRDLVPVNYTGGFTLFIGNNPEATAFGSYPLGISTDALLEEKETAALAEKGTGRKLKPSEVSSFWARKALEFAVTRPLSWFALTLQKAWFFWNKYEFSDNYDLQFIQEKFSTVLKLPLASFALIGCLGAIGLFLGRLKEPSGAAPLLFWTYFLSILPFWICDRYRLPALVFLLPAAGAALDRIFSAVRETDCRPLLKPCLFAFPFMLLCLAPLPLNMAFSEASAWGQLTTIHADAGRYGKALQAFGAAARLAPESLNPEVISAAALSLEGLGKPGDAMELYKLGSELYPASATLCNNWGRLLFSLGRAKEAAALLEKAAMIDADPGKEYRNLFYVCRKLGRKKDAVKYGELAAARFPEDARLKADLEAMRK